MTEEITYKTKYAFFVCGGGWEWKVTPWVSSLLFFLRIHLPVQFLIEVAVALRPYQLGSKGEGFAILGCLYSQNGVPISINDPQR